LIKPDAKQELQLPRRSLCLGPANAGFVLPFGANPAAARSDSLLSTQTNILVHRFSDEVKTHKASKTYEATNSSIHMLWKIISRRDCHFLSWAVNAGPFPDPGAASPVSGDDDHNLGRSRYGTGSQATE
jgi:hypothetical protein